MTQELCGIACHDCVRGNVFRNYTAGTNDGAFTDTDTRENGRSRADRGTLLNQRSLNSPVCFSLQLSFTRRGTWVGVIDKRDPVSDKNIVFDRDPFTDKSVARDFAASTDDRIFLDFNKSTYFGFIADFTSVKIDEFGQLYMLSESDIRSDA